MRSIFLPLGIVLVCHCFSSIGEPKSSSSSSQLSGAFGNYVDGPALNTVEDDSAPTSPPHQTNPNSWKEIPLSALVQLSNVSDIATFLRDFVTNAKVVKDSSTNEEYLEDTHGKAILNSRRERVIVTPGRQTHLSPNGDNPSERNPDGGGLPQSRSGTLPISTKAIVASEEERSSQKLCTPEKITLPVPLIHEPHITILPRCVRVERCGGCCLSDIMVCEPVTMDTVDFHIKLLAFTGDGQTLKYEFWKEEVVKVERHKSCQCKCREKPQDCNIRHEYIENECTCACKNKQQYKECKNLSHKVWDRISCMCVCRQVQDCSSGLYFSDSTCDCQPLRRRKH